MNRGQRRAQWRSNQRTRLALPAWAEGKPAGTAGVHFHVGALVVRGFGKAATNKLAASFERRLGELLRERPAAEWKDAGTAETLRLQPLRLRSRDAGLAGERLAKAVFAARTGARRWGSAR